MDVSGACGVVYRDYNKLLCSGGGLCRAECAPCIWAGTFVAMRPVDRQRTLSDEDVFFSIHQRLGVLVEEVFGIVEGSKCGHCDTDMYLSHLTIPEVQPQAP